MNETINKYKDKDKVYSGGRRKELVFPSGQRGGT